MISPDFIVPFFIMPGNFRFNFTMDDLIKLTLDEMADLTYCEPVELKDSSDQSLDSVISDLDSALKELSPDRGDKLLQEISSIIADLSDSDIESMISDLTKSMSSG